jgi:hypothetical protein
MGHLQGGVDRKGGSWSDLGQSTVEFAVLIPIIVVAVLAIVQVVVLVRAQFALIDACRSVTRTLIVSPDEDPRGLVANLNGGLDGLAVTVEGSAEHGELITVHCARETPTDVPLIGPLLPSYGQRERFVAMVEGPEGI